MLPELYMDKKSWDEWIDHFESVADVCGWDVEKKLKWIHVRLSVGLGLILDACLKPPDTTTKVERKPSKTGLSQRVRRLFTTLAYRRDQRR